jgi:hypothetical protein
MIDLDDIRQRPWVQVDWQNQLGLSSLVASSVIEAIANAQVTWPELTEADLDAYKASERRELLRWNPPDHLDGMFKRFEIALKAGNVTEFGRILQSSPHRYDWRVVSVLSSNARIQNVRL